MGFLLRRSPDRSFLGCATHYAPSAYSGNSAAKGRRPAGRSARSLHAQRDRSLRGVVQEREGLLQVQLHGFGVVRQVSDRHVGAQVKIEIPAASGQYERAID